MFLIAGGIGLFSGVAGNVFSLELSDILAGAFPEERLSLPTGPMIVLSASLICYLSLFFAPDRGLLSRNLRAIGLDENVFRKIF